MKKKYIIPETEVYFVKTSNTVMLAVSGDADNSTIFSKGGNEWEDDEEEDY